MNDTALAFSYSGNSPPLNAKETSFSVFETVNHWNWASWIVYRSMLQILFKHTHCELSCKYKLSCSVQQAIKDICANQRLPQKTVRLFGKLSSQSVPKLFRFNLPKTQACPFQWPRGLGCRSAADRLLRLWVRIPPEAWMSVFCECCVLSCRGPTDCGTSSCVI